MSIEPHELARHFDRVRRRFIALIPDLVVRDIPDGVMSVVPGAPEAEFASTSRDRALWFAGESLIGPRHVEAAIEFAREHGRRRAFFWAAPWLIDAKSEEALAMAGASLVPHVEYIALGCDTGVEAAASAAELATRIVPREEAPGVFDEVRSWFGNEAVRTSLLLMEAGAAEVHGAFIGGKPIALALLTIDDQWAHLQSAVTNPEFRGRGAQKALIRARVRCAAERGARWCSAQTNNVVTISLTNLQKCGFAECLRWRVYQWGDPTG